jgi:hypothetical protein
MENKSSFFRNELQVRTQQLSQVGKRYVELRELLRDVEEQVEVHNRHEACARTEADEVVAEERDQALGELRTAERAARAARAEGSVLRMVAEGVEAEVERYRLEEAASMRNLHMMRLEVSGARSDLERLWAREQRVETASQAELQANLAAELRFANETRSQAEECRRALRSAQEMSETENRTHVEKVKALEVEVEKKSRTPVWSPVGWSGWQGWGARWDRRLEPLRITSLR